MYMCDPRRTDRQASHVVFRCTSSTGRKNILRQSHFIFAESGDEVQRKRNELDAKLLALEGLKRMQVILEPALSNLSVIGNKLWVDSQIFLGTQIHADIVGIEKSLDMASKGAREAVSDSLHERVFLNNLRPSYSRLV